MKSTVLLLIFTFFLSIGSFARSNYSVDGNDVIINLDGFGVKSNLLKIEIWTPSTIKVISTMNDDFVLASKLSGRRSNEKIQYKVAYAQNHIEIKTSNLMINIAEDGMVRLLSRDGKKLIIESDRKYEPSEKVEDAFKITQRFFLSRNENIYGFGHNEGVDHFNLRGQSFDVAQDNSSIASPVFISEKGYALYWDNYSATRFTDAPSGLTIESGVADEISFFFTYGPDWSSVVSEIRKITGSALLLPQWAYGFHLNSAAYDDSSKLNAAIRRYQSLSIPVETQTVDQQFLVKEVELTSEVQDPRNQNVTAFLQLRKEYNGLNEKTNEKRLVIPTHINLPGIQKYGTFTVAGEINTSWKALSNQVGAAINSALTGQPYWSTSLGGVIDEQQLSKASMSELLVRWYQFACFTPVFQGAVGDREIWDAGQPDDDSFKAISKAIQLRYQLMPYVYSTASSVAFDNGSMLRSLLFDFREDDGVHDIDQQYMFGKSLMVCPITVQGTDKVDLYLPIGTKWYDFWSGKLLDGGQKITEQVTIDHIPFYVKQGSILPFIPILQSADSVAAPLEIRIYGGKDADFTLYEDENDGVGYLFGRYSKIKFSYTQKNNTLTISSFDGGFSGMLNERSFNIVLVSEEDGMGILPSTTVHTVEYKGKKVKIKF